MQEFRPQAPSAETVFYRTYSRRKEDGTRENFQEAMHGLHEKIVTKSVSKDFFRFVLDQEQRMRAAKIREAEEAKEKQEILRRAQELQRREEEAQVCLSPAEGMLRVMQLWS